MNKRIVLVCLALFACAQNVTDPLEVKPLTSFDAGTMEASVVYSAPVDAGDAGMDAFIRYDPCVTAATKGTTYPRLTERICTDSLGSTYSRDFYDSQLGMGCRWRLTNDARVHCVPENEQSSPEYADDKCTVALGLIAVKADRPYIGLDTYTGDAGESYLTYYNAGKEFTGDRMFFLMRNDDDMWECDEETPLSFLGIKTYYLGDPIDPITFVEQ